MHEVWPPVLQWQLQHSVALAALVAGLGEELTIMV
jgi:hypothetical protein